MTLDEIEPGKLYTVDEVAEFLNMHNGSILRLIKQKKLIASKIGFWKIPGSSILDHFRASIDKFQHN